MTEKIRNRWTRVAFGDVVELCQERSSNPAEDGFDYYVGLDHLDPGDLTIRRWGNITEGTTFTSVFHPGQVLFGKRRAYQRKLAVAEFKGVCSGDIYVFKPKDDQLLPELLPFICQTDDFFDYAIGTSDGSLSPRTNWKSLSSYEFALPPLEEQRRIVEVLSTADSVIFSIMHLLDVLDSLTISFVVEQLDNSHAPIMRLGAIATFERGCSYKSTDYVKEGVGRPFLNLKSVTRDARFSEVGVKWVRKDFEPNCKIKIGDLFFANTDLTPEFLLVGAPFFFPGIEANSDPCFSMDLTRVISHSELVETRYLYYLLTLPRVRTRMRVLTRGSTVGHLQLSAVPSIEVPVLPAGEQIVFLKRMDGIQASRQAVVDRLAVARAFRDEILQSTFGEVSIV